MISLVFFYIFFFISLSIHSHKNKVIIKSEHLLDRVGHNAPHASRLCRYMTRLQGGISLHWRSGSWRCILGPRFPQSRGWNSLGLATLPTHVAMFDLSQGWWNFISLALLWSWICQWSNQDQALMNIDWWIFYPLCRSTCHQLVSSQQSCRRSTPGSSSFHRYHFYMDSHNEPPAMTSSCILSNVTNL